MEKINAFLKKHGIITILIVMLLSFVNQCSIKNSIDRNTKYTKELVKEIKAQDSLINMKMDSTLISNTAVVNTKKQSNNAKVIAIHEDSISKIKSRIEELKSHIKGY